jgi:hypothetical protein
MKCILTLALLVVLITEVKAQSLTLAWDYTSTVSNFVLERKTGLTGTYSTLPLVIPGTARTAIDTTVTIGQLYCYRIHAEVPPARSAPSNEACGAVLSAPINLRIQ